MNLSLTPLIQTMTSFNLRIFQLQASSWYCWDLIFLTIGGSLSSLFLSYDIFSQIMTHWIYIYMKIKLSTQSFTRKNYTDMLFSRNELKKSSVLISFMILILFIWGEWSSGPASSISLAEVRHGCVRSETGWVTSRWTTKTAHSTVLRKGR